MNAPTDSLQQMDGRTAGTTTAKEERRWWVVEYRHTTKAPHWFRLRECHVRADVEPLVKYWTGRGCDVRVMAVVEVVERTTTIEEPVVSSPIDQLCREAGRKDAR